MRKAKKKRKTHFEQISLQAIEKLRLQDVAAEKAAGRVRRVVIQSPATKTQPYSVRILIDATGR
jgi:hypothetical protein